MISITEFIVNITFLYVEQNAQNVYLNYCHLAIKDTQIFKGNLMLPKSLINIPWNKNSMLPTIVILSTKKNKSKKKVLGMFYLVKNKSIIDLHY